MKNNTKFTIVECPRDAMQGIKKFIPTKTKASYINSLTKVGYDIIDFGSFVSPKAMPQMKDTAEVLKLLNLNHNTRLLAIVLNLKGASEALRHDEISILGYPLSISEIFQKNNSGKSISNSLNIIDKINNLCIKKNKNLLVYLSMAFGNPYGEYWNSELVFYYIDLLKAKSINMISLADTIGIASTQSISDIYSSLFTMTNIDFGLHLHTSSNTASDKINAAWNAGCRRFDVTINGLGGCPFAQDTLTGNVPTESFLNFLSKKNINHNLDLLAFEAAYNQAKEIFTV
tara:strand:- start:348 stop:1208 length:861 start_codon:yes stop_codon:yes gene_type:complete